MLKSFDYVDPLLSQKIHTLEQELLRLQASKLSIVNDTAILPTTKAKLIRYQSECEQSTRQLL